MPNETTDHVQLETVASRDHVEAIVLGIPLSTLSDLQAVVVKQRAPSFVYHISSIKTTHGFVLHDMDFFVCHANLEARNCGQFEADLKYAGIACAVTGVPVGTQASQLAPRSNRIKTSVYNMPPATRQECDDRATVVAEMSEYVWKNQAVVDTDPANLAECWTNQSIRCQHSNSKHHIDGAGAPIRPFGICLVCERQANYMLSNDRRRANAADDAPYNIRGRPLDGIRGAHTRGHLCDICVAVEIEAYHNRRWVGRRTRVDLAASTCKCEKALRKRLCYRDKRDLMTSIQKDTDRFAGPDGWLEHLDYDSYLNRAIFVADNTALRRRRKASRRRRNACRCGRDLRKSHADETFNTPTPVAMCTACSGVVVDPTHPKVTNWNGTTKLLPGESHLRLGRAVPGIRRPAI